MADFYTYGSDKEVDNRVLMVMSNMSIGIPRVEKNYAITDDFIHLRGPAIEINHPDEYNSLKYRTIRGPGLTYETMKYGVAGIHNVTTSSWITSNISDIDSSGTTIKMSSGVSSGDEIKIYYYAAVASLGGGYMGILEGDMLLPETIDILTRVYNDAVTSRFGSHTYDQGDVYQWYADAMYNTSVSCSSDVWTTLLDYSSTGTFRMNGLPAYINEVAVNIGTPSSIECIKFKITVDGTLITRGFGTDATIFYERDQSLFPESGGPYTNTPGMMMNGTSSAMFFDIYKNNSGDKILLFNLGTLTMKSGFKVEIMSTTYSLTCDIYVRAVIDSTV